MVGCESAFVDALGELPSIEASIHPPSPKPVDRDMEWSWPSGGRAQCCNQFLLRKRTRSLLSHFAAMQTDSIEISY